MGHLQMERKWLRNIFGLLGFSFVMGWFSWLSCAHRITIFSFFGAKKFRVICDRALLEMLEFGNSFTNNIQSKVDVGLIKPYRKHLLIKRCDCFTCLQFDCRKMSYCSQLTQRTVVVLFLSFCIFFIVCQRTILVSTFYGWYMFVYGEAYGKS